jgi:hypothetical protein
MKDRKMELSLNCLNLKTRRKLVFFSKELVSNKQKTTKFKSKDYAKMENLKYYSRTLKRLEKVDLGRYLKLLIK